MAITPDYAAGETSNFWAYGAPLMGVVLTIAVHGPTPHPRIATEPEETYKTKEGVSVPFSPALAFEMKTLINFSRQVAIPVLIAVFLILGVRSFVISHPSLSENQVLEIGSIVLGILLIVGSFLFLKQRGKELEEFNEMDDQWMNRALKLMSVSRLYGFGTYNNSLDPHQIAPSMSGDPALVPNMAYPQGRSLYRRRVVAAVVGAVTVAVLLIL